MCAIYHDIGRFEHVVFTNPETVRKLGIIFAEVDGYVDKRLNECSSSDRSAQDREIIMAAGRIYGMNTREVLTLVLVIFTALAYIDNHQGKK